MGALRDAGLDVLELPADEATPRCVYVGDIAVVCNGTALLCRPRSHVRRGEVPYMKSILQRDLGINVLEIADPAATIEGGDVLFTGREFFVGLSERTNEAGALALAKAFPEFPCTPIMSHTPLKRLVTMAGSDVLCVAKDSLAAPLLKRINECSLAPYRTLTLPLPPPTLLPANATLLHPAASEWPESAETVAKKLSHYKLRGVELSELSKAGGDLTSCCILIRR